MSRRWWRRALVTIVAAAVVSGGAVVPLPGLPDVVPAAQAATASEFRPGSIISDALFFDGSAMSATDVQWFLDVKRPTCTAGYTCLKSYVTSTTDQPAEAGLCNGYVGRAAETAAQIIARVGQSCGISQKVLLVLLQKEQGLVTSAAPSATQYQKATGFACPDTAPCDAQYFGFFNQVYKAARQYKRYAATPQNWSYRAGRTNTILYNPNRACGSSSVYIENQATAGLYTYTPYQPNAAALNNLSGTGDACSAYGNRNFWRDYSDWFGSTQTGANLVKSTSSATVYLVTYDAKYPVDNVSTLASLGVLGGVGTVSQSYLDSKPTGTTLGRFVRDRGGNIYLFDTGRLFHVSDCAMLEAWGTNCGAYLTMALTDGQVAAFTVAGELSSAFVTPEGKRFWVEGGRKHEVADAASLALANPQPTTAAVTLSEQVAAALPYAAPLVRDDVVVWDRTTSQTSLAHSSGRVAVPAALVEATVLRTALPQVALDGPSVALMPAVRGTSAGLLRTGTGRTLALTTTGSAWLGSGQLATSAAAPVVSDAVAAALAPAAAADPLFVRSVSSASLFLVGGDRKRAVTSMSTVYALAAGTPVRVALLTQAGLDAVPSGPEALRPGALVKAAGSPDIFMVDGSDRRVHLPSFAVSDALGLGGYAEVPAATLQAYAVTPGELSSVWACGGARWVGDGGRITVVPAAVVDASGVARTTPSAATCATLTPTATSAGPVFVRAAGSADLYLASGGRKRAIPSMDTVYALAGGQPVVVATVSQADLAAMATGPAILVPGRLVKAVGSPDIYLVDGYDTLVHLPSFAVSDALGLGGYTEVPAATIAGYTVAPGELSTVWACGSNRYVGSGGRLVRVTTSVVDAAGVQVSTVDPATCAAVPVSSTGTSGPLFVRGADSADLFLAAGGTRRPIDSMDTVYALAAGQPVVIAVVAAASLAAMPVGAPLLTPGRLVKAVGAADIYLVDGTGTLVHLPSFEVADAIGLGGYREVPAATVAAYARASGDLSTVWSCGTARYVASGGRLVPVAAGVVDASGAPATVLDPATCSVPPRAGAASRGPVFVRAVGEPVIYLASGGTKRPVRSMDTVYALAGGQQPLIAVVAPAAVAAMPTGAAV